MILKMIYLLFKNDQNVTVVQEDSTFPSDWFDFLASRERTRFILKTGKKMKLALAENCGRTSRKRKNSQTY